MKEKGIGKGRRKGSASCLVIPDQLIRCWGWGRCIHMTFVWVVQAREGGREAGGGHVGIDTYQAVQSRWRERRGGG